MVEEIRVRGKTHHDFIERIEAIDLEASSILLQSLGLLELLIVRPEEHRNIPYCSLQQIVDTYAETATHICYTAIAVDA